MLSMRGLAVGTQPEGFTVDQILQEQSRGIVESQSKDPVLFPTMEYLEKNILPDDEKLSRRLVMEHGQYVLIDRVVHNKNPLAPGSWGIVVPKVLQADVLKEAHGGRFAGHFSEKKVYDTSEAILVEGYACRR